MTQRHFVQPDLQYPRKHIWSQLYFCNGGSSSWVIFNAVGKFQRKQNPLKWKLCWAFEKAPRRCKKLLQRYHGNGKESMKCWSQRLKVTQSIHVLIIPLPYERNITFFLSMMKINIRSFQQVYLSNEYKELQTRLREENQLHVF